MLRILADADIPLVAESLARYGTVTTLPGREITPDTCKTADVLLVRSVTRVDAALLAGTPVRFVGTATAGTDHLDAAVLAALGVPFADAPGSNASSVVEWVIAALMALATDLRGELRGRTLGVVGGGHVGGRLAPRAAALGMRVLVCDPPRARAAERRGEAHAYVPFGDLLDRADVVTFHTPLTRPGASPDPTHHLLDADAVARLRPGAWVLNASRGGVVDGAALLAALTRGHVAAAALDVWEGEPSPDPVLARAVQIATPHVAGYGYDAKLTGSRMMESALRAWLAAEGTALPPPFNWNDAEGPDAPLILNAPPVPDGLTPAAEAAWLDRLIRPAYSVRADGARFRAAVLGADDPAAAFTHLRRTYPRRWAWERFSVGGAIPPALRTAVGKGVRFREERQG